MTYQGHTVNGKARILRQSEHSWQIDWHFLLFTSARAEPWASQPSVPSLGVGMGDLHQSRVVGRELLLPIVKILNIHTCY